MGSSPALDQIFFVQFFFRFVRLFFANISKGSTRYFFVYFAKNGCSKTPRVPPFTCSGTMRLTGNQKKLKKIGKCNVRQSALQKFLKFSIKNSKCATSNKHIQDGRPGRYENSRGSEKRQNGARPSPRDRPCCP